jgi:thymidylate kinase
LSLEGLRGVGKSTVAPLLARELGGQLVPTVPSSYDAVRHTVDKTENLEARMCLFLSALFDAADHIQHLLDQGAIVVVESYFARCLATHTGMGARLKIVLPTHVPQPAYYRLTCSEAERRRRLSVRVKPSTRWDALAENSRERIEHAYDSFSMTAIDTTAKTPQQVVQAICDIIGEDAGDEDT